jgi:hypothetical protein
LTWNDNLPSVGNETIWLPRRGDSDATDYLRDLAVSVHEYRYLLHKALNSRLDDFEILLPRQDFPERTPEDHLRGAFMGIPFRAADVDKPMFAFDLKRAILP